MTAKAKRARIINKAQIKSKLTFNTNTILGPKAPITSNDAFIIHKAPKITGRVCLCLFVKKFDGKTAPYVLYALINSRYSIL